MGLPGEWKCSLCESFNYDPDWHEKEIVKCRKCGHELTSKSRLINGNPWTKKVNSVVLDKIEEIALVQIHKFSKARKFKLGLSEAYVTSKNAVQKLFNKKLVYYKSSHGNKYWLPTKKGGEVVVQLL